MAQSPVTDSERAVARRIPAVWGPSSGLGLVMIVLSCVLDQVSKFWVLHVLDLAPGKTIALSPFIHLVLTTNKGISYGLFQQDGPIGQWALLGLSAIAVVLLWLWLARADSRLTAIGLGLIIGGAIGNAVDRVLYGSVNDFILLKYWPYAFNFADVAIVVGVAGLFYDSLMGGRAAKAPRSGG